MDYEIYCLHIGTFIFGEQREPIHVWLIKGNGRNILVDAGTPDPQVVRDRWKTGCDYGGPEVLAEKLKECGVSAEEIDTVVLTHLHFDHAWNIDRFPQAQVVVQRAEVIHAIDPTPTHRGYYNQKLNGSLIQRKKSEHLLIIDGDQPLAPGIDLMLIPGHTPGIMGVIVQTVKGRVGLPSDAGDSYANWFPADPRANPNPIRFLADSYMPPHILTESVATCIASLKRFHQACDIVVPSHDARIPKRIPAEWFAVPTPQG